MRDAFVDLFTTLSQAHGASGSEGPVRRTIREALNENGETDALGNVMFRCPGSADRPVILVAAHMDEVGMAVQSITGDGFLRFVPLGGMWNGTLPGLRVRVRTRADGEVTGVIATKPVHFQSSAEKRKLPEIENLFIDVGAADRQDAEENLGIRLGDPIVPDASATQMPGRDLLLAKAMDDRLGVTEAVMLHRNLAAQQHPNTVWVAGTVQEELGARGARTICESLHPDVCLVLEGTPADDLPGSPPDERQAIVGAGVQVRLSDSSALMHRALVDFVIDVARECDIPHQLAVRRSGGTDAQAIHLHGRGVPTVVLGTPARYIHTANSIASISDCLAGLRLAAELVKSLDQDAIRTLTTFRD